MPIFMRIFRDSTGRTIIKFVFDVKSNIIQNGTKDTKFV